MNSIARLQKLSGITVTEAQVPLAKKYADYDKAGLEAAKKEIKNVMALASRASFKYKNAAEELKCVEEAIKNLETPQDKKEKVEEGMHKFDVYLNGELIDTVYNLSTDADGVKADLVDHDHYDPSIEVVLREAKDDDKDEDDKEDKKDESDKKDDDKEDEDKDSDKKDDDKPAFLKDKKDEKDSDKDDEEEEKEDKKSEKKDDDSDEDDKDDDKKSDKKDEDDKEDEKTVKVEVKVEESAADIAARLMAEAEKKPDLTPTEVEVDYENGPTYNSGIKFEQGTKIRLPNAVKAAVNKRIKELESAILRYDDKGYDDKSIKQQAVDCLKQLLQDLSTNDLEGVKKAQVYMGTLMSPLTDFFPPQIINWLANAINPYVGNVSEAVNDDRRKLWMQNVISKGGSIDSDALLTIAQEFQDANLKQIASIGYLEAISGGYHTSDHNPFAGVTLSPEELKAFQWGLDFGKEHADASEEFQSRQEAGYRSPEDIDDPMNENARYNRDFEASDDMAHSRLNGIFKKLESMLYFANPSDQEANQKIASWVQSNVGQAFWSSVADWLLDRDFKGAFRALNEFAAESGY